MSLALADFQSAPLTIDTDNTEQPIYSWLVHGGTISQLTRHHLHMIGAISTKTLAPGSITLRLKFGALSVSIVADTVLAGAVGGRFIADLDCWFIPGGPDHVMLAGQFHENAAGVLTPTGSRSNSLSDVVDLSIDNYLTVTWQFSVAHAMNSLTRSLAVLLITA